MEKLVKAKIKLLEQLGITPSEEEKRHLAESTSEYELERRTRDIIVPPMKRELVLSR